MIERYSRKELKDIWEDYNKYSIWLDIELAAAESMEKLKIIPKGVVKKVKSKGKINVKRILDIESKVKHDVIAFLTSITEKTGKEARYLHKGMTSSDVLDTCFNLQLKQSGNNTRFDFLITKKNFKAFIEVKNVTLMRKASIAEFPDSVTSRGAKHINELLKASKSGYKIYIAFIIQREDCNLCTIARDIDPEYSDLLSKAVKKKLNILSYDCKFSSKGIKVNKRIKFKI